MRMIRRLTRRLGGALRRRRQGRAEHPVADEACGAGSPAGGSAQAARTSDPTGVGGFAIEAAHGQAGCSMRLEGTVVIATSPRLRTALLDAIRDGAGRDLVVDAAGLRYLDTSGIATLLEAAQAARRRAVRLTVAGLDGQPGMLARITELDRILPALGCEVQYR
jgi:anti-sigma B factor antagonist